jgi:hypothetical protein
MPKLQSIHFVAGLGANSGKPLAEHELIAIELAAKLHPAAVVYLHTDYNEGSLSNYDRSISRRVRWQAEAYSKWPSWAMQHGSHMADKLRVQVLLQPGLAGQYCLYLDTDAFALRNLDHLCDIEGTAMARLGPSLIANGLIYSGPDKGFLQAWHIAMLKSKPPLTPNEHSCRLMAELHSCTPGLAVLSNSGYHGVCGDTAFTGYWQELNSDLSLITETNCSVAHVMSSSAYSYDKFSEGTRASYLLKHLRNAISEL